MHSSGAIKTLTGGFLAILILPALIQLFAEVRSGEIRRTLQVFTEAPTAANLRSYEKSLERESVTANTLRPWMQAAQFFATGDAGEKTLLGHDGWLFYQPGIQFHTQRPHRGDSTVKEAVTAVIRYRDDLAARGIRFVVMPAPNKESIYPDKLIRFHHAPTQVMSEETRSFMDQCRSAGVECIDLFALYSEARRNSQQPLYLMQDTHWSPAGMEMAAASAAQKILTLQKSPPASIAFESRPTSLARLGDLLQMVRSPVLERLSTPESISCHQIFRQDTPTLYQDDPTSSILVLGDSFLRIYQQDDPHSAGFVAHLAKALGQPLTSIISDGGASTLVRQQLFRKPALLKNKTLVLWEFVERDLRLGTEGWQIVPLPPSDNTP